MMSQKSQRESELERDETCYMSYELRLPDYLSYPGERLGPTHSRGLHGDSPDGARFGMYA